MTAIKGRKHTKKHRENISKGLKAFHAGRTKKPAAKRKRPSRAGQSMGTYKNYKKNRRGPGKGLTEKQYDRSKKLEKFNKIANKAKRTKAEQAFLDSYGK